MIFAFLKRVILPSAVILFARANSDMCPQARESDASYYLKRLRLSDIA